MSFVFRTTKGWHFAVFFTWQLTASVLHERTRFEEQLRLHQKKEDHIIQGNQKHQEEKPRSSDPERPLHRHLVWKTSCHRIKGIMMQHRLA